MRPPKPAAGGSTNGREIHTSRSEDGNGRCRNFANIKTLQKFAAVHDSIHNHFNADPDDACELFGVVGLGSSVDGCFTGSDDAADLLRLVVLESGLHEYAAEFDRSGDETFIGPV